MGVGKGGGGRAEGAGADADEDEVGGDFDDGVVRARKAVEGGVGAEEGGPGGPEFGLELGVQGWVSWDGGARWGGGPGGPRPKPAGGGPPAAR